MPKKVIGSYLFSMRCIMNSLKSFRRNLCEKHKETCIHKHTFLSGASRNLTGAQVFACQVRLNTWLHGVNDIPIWDFELVILGNYGQIRQGLTRFHCSWTFSHARQISTWLTTTKHLHVHLLLAKLCQSRISCHEPSRSKWKTVSESPASVWNSWT